MVRWRMFAALIVACVSALPAAATDRAMLEDANKDGVLSVSELDAIEKTSDAIRAAYASGDAQVIMALHHPQVIKAINYDKVLIGYDAVAQDLARSLAAGSREFVEQTIERVLLYKRAAVQQARYTIRITPTDGRASFLTRGRSMVIYVPYVESPTGWAILHGFIQPDPD